jgi:Putative Flp pilus-assembly TadE/G-like
VARLARDESGQIFPILLVLTFAILAIGAVLLQVGRGTALRAGAQTAADAAALAGARELEGQLLGADGSYGAVDEEAVEAAAADYAERNDAELREFALTGCGVTVTVASEATLEGAAAEDVGVEDEPAVAEAAAALGSGGISAGPFGAPPEGEVPEHLRPAARLAASLGLTITSTTGGVHTAGSLPYQGLAMDVSNSSGPTAEMSAFYRAAERMFAGRILELFYDPEGGIENNQQIGQIGDHSDHVHIALAPGGTTLADIDAEDVAVSAGTPALGVTVGPQLVPTSEAGACTSAAATAAGAIAFAADASSIEIGRAVCRLGRELGVSDKVMLAAFEAGIVESGMRSLSGGDRDSAGVFQQRPSQGWGTWAQVTDVHYATTSFLTRAMAAERSGQTAGQLAQEVQRSAFPLRYDQAQSAAMGLMGQAGCA